MSVPLSRTYNNAIGHAACFSPAELVIYINIHLIYCITVRLVYVCYTVLCKTKYTQ